MEDQSDSLLSAEASPSPSLELPSQPSTSSSETEATSTSNRRTTSMLSLGAFLDLVERDAGWIAKPPTTPSSSPTPKPSELDTGSSSKDFETKASPLLFYSGLNINFGNTVEGVTPFSIAPSEAIRDVPQEIVIAPPRIKVPTDICPANREIQTPSHTEDCFHPERFKKMVDQIAKKLQTEYVGQFDALAGCGNSGTTMVSALSYVLGVPMTIVRKEKDHNNHHGQDVTGYMGSGKYFIIDDMISSGATIHWIIDEMERASATGFDSRYYKPMECAGICLYRLNHQGWNENGAWGNLDDFSYNNRKIPVHWVGDPNHFRP
jgi:hypothetical protein